MFSSRIVLRRAQAIVEQRDNFVRRQCMSFSLQLVLRGTLLGKSPFISTSFVNLAIDERLEAVRNPIATY